MVSVILILIWFLLNASLFFFKMISKINKKNSFKKEKNQNSPVHELSESVISVTFCCFWRELLNYENIGKAIISQCPKSQWVILSK